MHRIFNVYRLRFLELELTGVTLAWLAFVVWAEQFGGSSLLQALLSGSRADIYGTVASICGSLFGFAVTAVSVVIAVSGSTRLRLVRESKHFGDLWRIFFSCIRWLGVATLVLVAGLLLDRDAEPQMSIFYLSTLAVGTVGVRLVRTVWVLRRLVELVSAPSKGRPPIPGG